MHYYQFNIKDYSFATIRMSLMEDLAFRRMLDLFYESEKPLPLEIKRIAKLIGMLEYQEEIKDVLSDFWKETVDGWVNSRANDEIVKYQSKAESARTNGKKGGRPKTQEEPKKTQLVNLANPEKSESKANHKPITNNHKPVIKDLSVITDGFEHWWNLYPSSRRKNKKGCLVKFKVKCKNLNDDQVEELVNVISLDIQKRISTVKESARVKRTTEAEEFVFMPMTEPYLNQERWNDGL
tara:strand:- start:1845 stop:2558 length:714 start_codon:yes stop_codon:yes gene_type:complete